MSVHMVVANNVHHGSCGARYRDPTMLGIQNRGFLIIFLHCQIKRLWFQGGQDYHMKTLSNLDPTSSRAAARKDCLGGDGCSSFSRISVGCLLFVHAMTPGH